MGDDPWERNTAATPIATGADHTPKAPEIGDVPDELAFSEELRFAAPPTPTPTATLSAVNDDPEANLRSAESAASVNIDGVGDNGGSMTMFGIGGVAIVGAAGAALAVRRRQAQVAATDASFEGQKAQPLPSKANGALSKLTRKKPDFKKVKLKKSVSVETKADGTKPESASE